MARSKQLHVVNFTYEMTQGNDPTQINVFEQADIALQLSKQLGKNIRQGHAFRLVGYGAHLSPRESSNDADTGMAAAVRLGFAPVTRHSVKAWNQMFKKWQKQKQLSGKVGQYVRYDDFELAYKAAFINSRTSTVFAGGMGDTNSESITIYDPASSGNRTSIQDMYNSYQPIPEPSTDEFGVSIKSPKFSEFFPEERYLTTSAHMSSNAAWVRFDEVNPTPGVADYLADSQNVHYMGGSSESNMVFFPADNHVSILAGLMNVQAYLLPPDVDTGDIPPTGDELYLTITLVLEGWSPLAEGVSVPRKQLNAPKKTRRSNRRA